MHPIPEKKNKIVGLNTKMSEKHVCLQCMEMHLQGKRDERFTSICRLDPSSIKRHKERWHNLPNNKLCSFVSLTAPEVAALADKYAKVKVRNESKGCKVHVSCHTKSLSISQPLPSVDENPINENNEVSEINSQGLQGPEKTNEHPNQKELASNPHHPFDDDPSADFPWQKSSLSAKNQKTLFAFAKPDTTVLEKDASLKQAIDAVAELSLKVENIGKQHTTFLQLAFEDKDVRRSVSVMTFNQRNNQTWYRQKCLCIDHM